MVELWKSVNGHFKRVDWGVPALAESYASQGYVVIHPAK
jgi:hypothetical protein